jgi:hypothetical protein
MGPRAKSRTISLPDDTGRDAAYLRQDESLMYPLFPSSTVFRTAGPEELKALQTGFKLVHLKVKDYEANLHEFMLENALVVSRLSQI